MYWEDEISPQHWEATNLPDPSWSAQRHHIRRIQLLSKLPESYPAAVTTSDIVQRVEREFRFVDFEAR